MVRSIVVFGIQIAPPQASVTFKAVRMSQPLLLWPALILLAGAAATAPTMENASNRAILYWLILPSLAVGIAAMFSHVRGF